MRLTIEDNTAPGWCRRDRTQGDSKKRRPLRRDAEIREGDDKELRQYATCLAIGSSSNCCSSVEPASAVMEEVPPIMI